MATKKELAKQDREWAQGIVTEALHSLRDLTGQLIEGGHGPTRQQLLRALSAMEKLNPVVPIKERVEDIERLRAKVMA